MFLTRAGAAISSRHCAGVSKGFIRFARVRVFWRGHGFDSVAKQFVPQCWASHSASVLLRLIFAVDLCSQFLQLILSLQLILFVRAV